MADIWQLFLQPVKTTDKTLSLGTVEFFSAGLTGTANHKPVYLDVNLTIEASNPYTLSAAGTAALYGVGEYHIIIKDSLGTTQFDYDYITPYTSGNLIFETQEVQTALAAQTVFTLTNEYVVSSNNRSLSVYVDGVRKIPVTDYAETDSTTVTFVTPMTGGETVLFIVNQYSTSVAGLGLIQIEYFDASATWTVPARGRLWRIICIGGGGGGGGAGQANAATHTCIAGAGGGGGLVEFLSSATISGAATHDVVIGAGGAGGAIGALGSDGGETYLSPLFYGATGGEGGSGASIGNTAVGDNGAGGYTSDPAPDQTTGIIKKGSNGHEASIGCANNTTATPTLYLGKVGTPSGFEIAGGSTISAGAIGAGNGKGYAHQGDSTVLGSGGRGGYSDNTSGGQAGEAGKDGYMIIETYA